ncbi:Zn-dependent M28 family amino/carboxypeptidase [Algoriphagus boseongensis]|uniref:Zn-dependent M28 family amino/carboxypeptidase n=1 Tax=Algoriphagus boseongensis TaxID=1442587 RepID=A0A4R6T9M8_9BACT|nr:M28 family peptidase [Algoriphagus boseongensis]TDQ18893.1 Zn-dependent M28 family amino/carboxypeptidase [Algoriphagus boseongensis]
MRQLFPILIFALLFTACEKPKETSSQLDEDTQSWWDITTTLSSDEMEGRDTGSPGYARAADVVAKAFAEAGLQPLGENGGWYQEVAMEETAIIQASVFAGDRELKFLHDIYAGATSVSESVEAPMIYCGYCDSASLGEVKNKLVICHGSQKEGLPSNEDRFKALSEAGALGMILIADPGYTIEPPRWPFAYSRSVRLAGSPSTPSSFLNFRLHADALGKLIEGSKQNATELIELGSQGKPLPTFEIPDSFKASFTKADRTLTSPNILARLEGTDPSLANQAIVLTAHLDGYGYGEPVDGDSLYNGTLDDAAYVALLVQLAKRQNGKGFKRPIIFAIVTGEEKGLLGSRYLVQNLPVAKESIAANINLDQLRPIFPLDLMTVHALDETTLGDDAAAVAASMQIRVQNDPEPSRNLIRRSDHWNFIQAGIPAINFVFGYEPGSESEKIYRQWYREGYHTPKDDLKQKIDWEAAAKFNTFFYGLVERVANSEIAPAWKPGSTLKPSVEK